MSATSKTTYRDPFERKRRPVAPMKHGDEGPVLEATIPIVEALYSWVNGVGLSFKDGQAIDRKCAEALWGACTFKVDAQWRAAQAIIQARLKRLKSVRRGRRLFWRSAICAVDALAWTKAVIRGPRTQAGWPVSAAPHLSASRFASLSDSVRHHVVR
jgi:hypothetical protein